MRQQNCLTVLAKYIQFVLLLGAVSLFVIGKVWTHIDLLLVSLLVLFLANVVYGVQKFRERVLFTLFNCACMFFLFGRNVVQLFSGEDWQYRFSDDVNVLIITLIFSSMLFLFVGSYVADKICVDKREIPRTIAFGLDNEELSRQIQLVSFVLYWICTVFLFACETDKLLFMRGKEYYQYYAEYKSRLPGVFSSIGALAKFCLCLFLATKPSKRLAFFPLAAYLASTVPMFLIGQRNPLISAGLLVFCYYIMRDYADRRDGDLRKPWMGKAETSIILLALPFLLAFLSMYESIRYGKAANTTGIFESILKLLRSQGVTYDIVGKGLAKMDVLGVGTNYTFGPFIVYLISNSISVRLFGTTVIKAQTVESALSGFNFGDSVSYLYLGESFVEGAGLGSSYIIECYLDFGLIGLLIYSAFLGFLLVYSVKYFNRSIAGTFVVMLCMISIFMVPRASALRFAVLLVYVPMFLMLFAIFLLSALLVKKYYRNSGKGV